MVDALILVDIQNDFLPGGALAVNAGDEVISVANEQIARHSLVIATQDWHPADHLSFASQHAGRSIGEQIELDGLPQVLWPDHCVQQTKGAELAAELNSSDIHFVVRKGTNRNIDSYSGFFDNGHRQATELAEYLKSQEVSRVYVMGLATDYCVKFTALDAIQQGLETHVLLDGCRGVNLSPGDIDRAIEEMQTAGIVIV